MYLSFILGAILSSLRLAAAQGPACSDSAVELCIDPVAAGEEFFDFLPMFPSSPLAYFTYAFQMRETPSGASAVKAGFWVDYETADLDPSANQETYMAFLMVDGDGGDPGERPWPCDRQMLEPSCQNELEYHLIRSVAPGYAPEFGSLADALSRDNVTDAIIPLCPADILSRPTLVSGSPGLSPGVLAREDGSDSVVIPSGDFESPWAVEIYEDVTYEEQLRRVAVVVALQVPLPDGDRLSPNQVRITTSCARASADYEYPWLDKPDSGYFGGGTMASGGMKGWLAPRTFSTLLLVGSITAAMGVAWFVW